MNKSKLRFVLLLGVSLSSSTTGNTQIILGKSFDFGIPPTAPNYANPTYWAALPTKKDVADSLPRKARGLKNKQATAKADVFFIHPTIYTEHPKEGTFEWNADVNDQVLNQKVDESTILNQASVFNGSCKVYAPRYRQAHYYSFITKNKVDREKALDLAYTDIQAAFEYYLKNYNEDRPIVIASHSQGTLHAKRLLKEFFDGKPLQKQLVFAYLVGDIAGPPAQPDEFAHIKPTQSPEEVGGFASWHTYARDFFPDKYEEYHFKTAVCTNPLTWKLDEDYAPKTLNKGGVALKYTYKKHLANAQVHQGLLWIHKPYIVGRAFLKTKVWHGADINLFWQSIRDNVALRVENFLKNQ
ncbi:MAG: DUF3089 domain-containing protein [Spirosomataceae bacterium]